MKAAAALALLALAACSVDSERFRSDWEEQNAGKLAKERDSGEIVVPPALRRGDLVEFKVSASSDFRFFVDASSVGVSRDGMVRYVLLARSPAGAENVTYEAMNCRGSEYRVYAAGRPDGSWERLEVPWRALGPRARAQGVLAAEYFCPSRIAAANAGEAVMALRRGGHPLADAPHPISGR